ncbi:MAG: glycosyltransferase family 2 protein [Pirellulales bacterium]|nr:glycosyltransferase family 2 protein [Pirellulales bacterium]
MQRSITFCLPVYNEQTTLATTVAEILEVLPEIASRFELLIVDDGSTDATPELASDLAEHYPQLRLLHHGRRQGTRAALARGVREARGEIVLVREQDCAPGIDDVMRAWQRIDSSTHRIPTLPILEDSSVQTWVQKAIAWGQRRERRSGQRENEMLAAAFQQSAGSDWRWADRETLAARLTGEVVDLWNDHALELAPGLRRDLPSRAAQGRVAPQPRRPAFLDKVRDFATGE